MTDSRRDFQRNYLPLITGFLGVSALYSKNASAAPGGRPGVDVTADIVSLLLNS